MKFIVAFRLYIGFFFYILSVPVLGQFGELDTTFGQHGAYLTRDAVADFAVLQNGKILVASRTAWGTISVIRVHENGMRDNSFGSFAESISVSASGNYVSDILVQPDGKILVAGYTSNNTDYDFSLIRLTPDGNPDPEFGTNGKTRIPVSGKNDICTNVGLQSDGRILLIGYSSDMSHPYADISIVRLYPNGQPDMEFGNVLISYSSQYQNTPFGFAIQPDDKILLSGNAGGIFVARLNSDGTTDQNFGTGGIVVVAGETGTDMLYQGNGKILISGSCLTRLNHDGTVDTNFTISRTKDSYTFFTGLVEDQSGRITTMDQYCYKGCTGQLKMISADGKPFQESASAGDLYSYLGRQTASAFSWDGNLILGGSGGLVKVFLHSDIDIPRSGKTDPAFGDDRFVNLKYASGVNMNARRVAVQADGKIVVAGTNTIQTSSVKDYNFSVIRLQADGREDTGWDPSSKNIEVGRACDNATGMALNGNGKIWVSGYSFGGDDFDFSLLRLNEDGSMDQSFQAGGRLLLPVDEGNDYCYDLCAQPDGKLMLAGAAFRNDTSYCAVVRLNDDGSLDTDFGMDGYLLLKAGDAGSEVRSVALLEDGRIVLGGTAFDKDGSSFLLLRLLPDGSRDNGFGTGGIQVLDVASDTGVCVAVQPDGKILLGGSGAGSAVVVRFNEDGSIDHSFGSAGTLLFQSRGSVNTISIEDDGKLIFAGGVPGTGKAFLFRTDGRGVPDEAFGISGGVYRNDTGPILATAFTDDHKLVAASSDSLFRVLLYPSVQTGVTHPVSSTISVYPNPSQGTFTIDGKEGVKEVILTDGLGRQEVFYDPVRIETTMKGLLQAIIITEEKVYHVKVEVH